MPDTCPDDRYRLCADGERRVVAREDCRQIMEQLRDSGFDCVCWDDHPEPDKCYIIVK